MTALGVSASITGDTKVCPNVPYTYTYALDKTVTVPSIVLMQWKIMFTSLPVCIRLLL